MRAASCVRPEQRVDRAEQQIRCTRRRHRQSRRHADDRVAADRLEDDAGEGMRRTYPTSLAAFDITPAKTMTRVRSLRGAPRTSSRKRAPIKPLDSQMPMPMSATSTVPRGAKPVKLVTVWRRIRCRPSIDSSETGRTASPVTGCIATRSSRSAI
jgi:hypothetical protein